jgi:hypothetical protein
MFMFIAHMMKPTAPRVLEAVMCQVLSFHLPEDHERRIVKAPAMR